MQRRLEKERAELLTKIDVEACERRGGSVGYRGMFGYPRCIVPYADAGKECRDDSECAGRCLIVLGTGYKEPAVGDVVTGSCERDNATDGCFMEVIEGKVARGECHD